MTHETPHEGMRVRLRRDVERYPHFIAEAGRTGVVTSVDDDLIAVRMDEPLEGADEWDNNVHWYPGWGADPEETAAEAFARDCAVL